MRNVLKNLLGFSGSAAPLSVAFNAYVATLAALIELRMNITSGTNIPNQGSLGAAQNGTLTIAAGALAQSSPLGAGEAILWDGAATILTVPNNAAVDGVAKQTFCFLTKANSTGEGGFARLYEYGNSGFNAQIQATLATKSIMKATGNATSTSANSYLPAFGTWHWEFIQYDDAGDRKIHFFKGLSGAVTEASYTTQTAATGTQSTTTSILNIGNRTLTDNTYDGLFSRFLFFDKILSAAEMLQLTTLSGLT